MFKTLGLISLALLLSTTQVRAEVKLTRPQIIIDQAASTITMISTTGQTKVMPVMTGMKRYALIPGDYKVKFMAPCKEQGGRCKTFEDGLFRPQDKYLVSNLGAWGNPNSGVMNPIFFEANDQKLNAKMAKQLKGNFIPAIHSQIVRKDKKGNWSKPDNLLQEATTHGCVRADSTNGVDGDLGAIFTFVHMSYQSGNPVQIIVRGLPR